MGAISTRGGTRVRGSLRSEDHRPGVPRRRAAAPLQPEVPDQSAGSAHTRTACSTSRERGVQGIRRRRTATAPWWSARTAAAPRAAGPWDPLNANRAGQETTRIVQPIAPNSIPTRAPGDAAPNQAPGVLSCRRARSPPTVVVARIHRPAGTAADEGISVRSAVDTQVESRTDVQRTSVHGWRSAARAHQAAASRALKVDPRPSPPPVVSPAACASTCRCRSP